MKTDRAKILEARVCILRDKLIEQGTTYDRMQNKMFAIVGLLLTLGGLLTYNVFKINVPDTIVEWILFVAILVMLSVVAILVGYDYRATKNWSVPIGPLEDFELDAATDYESAMDIIHQDYNTAYNERDRVLDKKASFLNIALYLFITSVILLIVLKIGG